MTGHTTDNTLALGDITVLLLGSGDLDYRARASAYVKSLGCQLAVLETATGEQAHQALASVLATLETPFVVLAKDSDFLLPHGLQVARDWLCEHPESQGVQGYVLGMRPGNAVVAYHRQGLTAHRQPGRDARERVLEHALSGLQPWRALLRVQALRRAQAEAALRMADEHWLLGLSFALLRQADLEVLEHTLVVSECQQQQLDPDSLLPAVRKLRQWDEQAQAVFDDDEGFAIVRQFALTGAGAVEEPLLFTSPWTSVIQEPQRSFEARQWVELPYYSARLFTQLTAIEFLLHAWPAGQAQVRAVEGAWVRQHELLVRHANDNQQTLRGRYWQALGINLFAPQVCRQLLAVLTDEDEQARGELEQWLQRLQEVAAPALSDRLARTPSGQVMQTLAEATLSADDRKRVFKRLDGARKIGIALMVLDLDDDNEALQQTFDSVAQSGLRDMRIVVLKAGALPAITTARDTLHFIKVTADNVVTHLNQALAQLPSEWVLLLQAGDELAGSGLLRLQLELSQENTCTAVCGNDVQRDSDGRLFVVQRPSADIDLLRSRPDLMAPHWLIRREAALNVGGFSAACPQALEFDLLLRLVEHNGLGGLAHVDEYLAVGLNRRDTMLAQASVTLDRHLAQLGYRAQVSADELGQLQIEFRHPGTPLVSILLAAGEDMQQLATSLASIQQRTRYPRYEVLVVTHGELGQQANLGAKVRMLACPSANLAERLDLAAGQARGEYLVLMSDRSQVSNPGWIEGLLNQAQRPEVGVVGCQMHDGDGCVSHAGYELLEGQRVHASWLGRELGESNGTLSLGVVRGCHAVSADGLMVRKEVVEALGGLSQMAPVDLELCVRVAQAGLLVLMAPQAQLYNPTLPIVPDGDCRALAARAPWAFARAIPVDGAQGLAMPSCDGAPHWLKTLL